MARDDVPLDEDVVGTGGQVRSFDRVRPGYLTDLIIVDGNPSESFRHLYSFGAIRMGEDGEMYRTRGIVHTIKDGVVTENANLMREVERMVAESREGAEPLITQIPFLPGR